MKRMIVPVRFLTGMLIPFLLAGQQADSVNTAFTDVSVHLEAAVESVHVPLNRNVMLNVRISWQGSRNRIELETIDEPMLSHLEITGTSSSNQVLGGGRGGEVINEIGYTLKPTTLGMAYIESVVLHCRDTETDETFVLRTERISVEILPAVRETEGPDPAVRLAAVIVAVLLLLAAAGFVVMKRRRHGDDAEESASSMIREEVFLSELRMSVSLKEGDRKQAYTELLKLFKRYLSERFAIPAMELTTEDLLVRLSGTDLEETLVTRCAALFKEADVIRFSGQDVEPAVLESAYTFVETVFENALRDARLAEAENAEKKSRKNKH
ncbi:hypothetical protein JW948_03265 [bacterium]|nr:hypothetical protein [bacterium]